MRKILSFIFLFLVVIASAQIAERPNPPKLYNNLSNEFQDFLSSTDAATLENKLVKFSQETSNQICVVIVDDLNGLEAADYATKVINEWGVGKKGTNNGIVILIKPTGGANGRDLFIAIGYGLEGAIPDLATKRIREDEMYPYLKNGDNYTALDKATDKLMALAKGEINEKDYTRRSNPDSIFKTILLILTGIAFIYIFFFSKNNGGGGGGYTYSGSGRSFSTGGSSFGGGGGFGGFGGGGSGGGGSGGKW
ncbi:MAG: TPM domain-containing protein [Bacteroidota bacterium]|nr:TPM domain-containing protein [Bacteroidota bacterium]